MKSLIFSWKLRKELALLRGSAVSIDYSSMRLRVSTFSVRKVIETQTPATLER